MSNQIASLPRRPDAEILPKRGKEEYITIHYSGVKYTDPNERQLIIMEANYHLNKDWKHFTYANQYMYDYVILRNGTVIKTFDERVQKWHCANALGNAKSWSLHVLLGPGESMSDKQRIALFELTDQLRSECAIPLSNVVGHCEWPLHDGVPGQGQQRDQSTCPGSLILNDIRAYRANAPKPAPKDTLTFTLTAQTPIYTAPSFDAAQATINNVFAEYQAGSVVEVRHTEVPEWFHLTNELGFIPATATVSSSLTLPIPEYHAYSSFTKKHYTVDTQKVVDYVYTRASNKRSREEVEEIVRQYQSVGESVGIDWVLAIAQALHETDSFKSWWSLPPRNNFAGLGVSGVKTQQAPANPLMWAKSGDTWYAGMSFANNATAVRVHIAHILCYVYKDAEMNPAQLKLSEEDARKCRIPASYRGSAKTINGLNGRWAVPGKTYSHAIALIANDIIQKSGK